MIFRFGLFELDTESEQLLKAGRTVKIQQQPYKLLCLLTTHAGKVVSRAADLDFNGLQHDYGFGARFHTPFQTALRVEVAAAVAGVLRCGEAPSSC